MLLEYHDHLCFVLLQENWTALHFAAVNGKNNALKYMIDHGARVDDVTTYVSLYHNILCYHYWCALNDDINNNILILIIVITFKK